MDKCFCHLNGYAVKDATARNEIENILTNIGNLEDLSSEDKTSLVSAINEAMNSGGSSDSLINVFISNSFNFDSFNADEKQNIANAVLTVTENGTKRGSFVINDKDYSHFISVKKGSISGTDVDYDFTSCGEMITSSTKILSMQYGTFKIDTTTGTCKSISKTRTYINFNNFTDKTYVDTAIANAQLGGDGEGVDLSSYATKELTGELENLTTEDKSSLVNAINEVLNNSGISNSGACPVYTLNSSFNMLLDGSVNNDDKVKLGEIFTDAFKKGFDKIILNYNFNSTTDANVCFTMQKSAKLQNKPTSVSYFSFYVNNRYSNSSLYEIKAPQLMCNLSWDGDVCTVTGATLYVTKFKTLTTDNTASYTPTGDYNPATKKYVDDIVSPVNTSLSDLQHINNVKSNIIVATRSSQYDITNIVGTQLRIPVTETYFTSGDKFTIEDYGIKIGENVSAIRVNGSVTMKGIVGNMRAGIRIKRGDNQILLTECQLRVSDVNHVNSFEMSPVYTNVEAGDHIELYFFSNESGSITYYGKGNTDLLTYITVEAVY